MIFASIFNWSTTLVFNPDGKMVVTQNSGRTEKVKGVHPVEAHHRWSQGISPNTRGGGRGGEEGETEGRQGTWRPEG